MAYLVVEVLSCSMHGRLLDSGRGGLEEVAVADMLCLCLDLCLWRPTLASHIDLAVVGNRLVGRMEVEEDMTLEACK